MYNLLADYETYQAGSFILMLMDPLRSLFLALNRTCWSSQKHATQPSVLKLKAGRNCVSTRPFIFRLGQCQCLCPTHYPILGWTRCSTNCVNRDSVPPIGWHTVLWNTNGVRSQRSECTWEKNNTSERSKLRLEISLIEFFRLTFF